MSDPVRYAAELERWRQERDDFFRHHYATPLSDDVIAGFAGISYFPADVSWRFNVSLVAADSPVDIESSTGATSQYPGAGVVEIQFPTGPARLRVLWGEEDDLFVPFRDLTSGAATYSGGRYVVVENADGGGLVVDFNKATNPYCAYDEEFSCPLPPAENCLQFPVEVGERDFIS